MLLSRTVKGKLKTILERLPRMEKNKIVTRREVNALLRIREIIIQELEKLCW